MFMSYSIDFRRKVLEVKGKEELSLAKVSKRFGVAVNTVFLWSKKIEAITKRNKPAIKIDREALKRDVEEYPDAYQYERADRLHVSKAAIWYALRRLNVTYKKSLQHPRADPEKRAAFCEKVKQYKEEGRPLVSLDESGFAHDMPRTHGYAPQGSRCFGRHDWGAKGRTNVIGALLGSVLLTVSLFQVNIHTQIFTRWVINDLIPKLPPWSVVIMDNASFHQESAMKRALADAGHTLLYLPPYSPDLNPIEKNWAQAKAIRRRVGGSIEELFLHYEI